MEKQIILHNGQTHTLAPNEALAYQIEDFIEDKTRIAFEEGGTEYPLENPDLLAYIACGRAIYADKAKRIIPIYGNQNDIRRLTQKPTLMETQQVIQSEIKYLQHVLESRCNGERNLLEGQLSMLKRQLASLPICHQCQTPLEPETRLTQWKPGELFVCPKCGWTIQRAVLEKLQNGKD